jgi:MFS family permease
MALGQGMVFPVVPLLATEFDVSPGLAAQVVTLITLGRVVGLIPAGIVVDKFGRTQAMASGAMIVTVSAIVAGYAPLFVLLLAAQFFWGIGFSLWQMGREVATIEAVKPSQRGRVMSVLFGISAVGMGLGPAIGGVIADTFGFRSLFVSFGGLGLTVLAIALLYRVPPGPPAQLTQKLFYFGRISEIAPNYRLTFLVLIIATFVATLRMNTVNSMMPLFLGSYLGYSATAIGSLFGVMSLVTMIMMLPAGFISDKLGRKKATVPPAIISAGVFFAFPFANTYAQFIVLSILTGVSNGMALGSMTTYAYDIIPEGSRGRLQAMRRSIGELGGVSGPLFGGIIANIYHAGIAFLFVAPLQLLSAFLLVRVAKETLPSKRRGPVNE